MPNKPEGNEEMQIRNPNLVSVIIPAYNAQAYITECVESLLAQSHQELEIIVVNDGSGDDTGAICDGMAQKDGRVRVIHQKNAGVSAARNRGLREMTGAYVCFVDADDILPQNSVELLLSQLKAQDADVVYGNYLYVYGDRTVERYPRIPEGNYTAAQLREILIDDGTLSGITFGSMCAAIYRAQCIRETGVAVREQLKINEDGLFNIEYCMAVDKVRYIAAPVYYYRQWKSTKKPDMQRIITNLEAANAAIREHCTGKIPEELLEAQLRRRELFCVFQTSVTASGLSYRQAKQVYEAAWALPLIGDSREILDWEKVSRAKRLLWKLVCQKRYRSFYLAVHHVYPALQKILKR